MGYTSDPNVSPLEMMFKGCDGATRAEKFERYKAGLNESFAKGDSGKYGFAYGRGIIPTGLPTSAEKVFEKVASLTKAMSPDQLATIQGDIDIARTMIAEITKDWTTTNPLSTGVVPYDLQAPAKELVPLHTPLRNSTSRNNDGRGLATHWKRLDSINNAGGSTGSTLAAAGNLSPFMNSQSDTAAFGPMTLRRGKKINYNMTDQTAAYVEMGYSDMVTWEAQFAGAGFQDVRQLSRHALLWTHLMGEERAILYGRGSAGNGYSGAVSAPVISAADSGASGSLAASAYKIIVLGRAGFGATVQSNEVTVTPTVSHGITVTVSTEPVGALNYDLYVTAAAGGTGTETFQYNFVGNVTTFTSVATGAALPANADTTADANGYDGWLGTLPANGGYVNRVNAKLSTTAPGSEFQTAFQKMYQLNFAEPNDIWLDPNVKVELGNILQNNAQNLPFRIMMSQDAGTIGVAVTGLQNQLTSQMVPLNVHPFMPLGCVILRSTSIPYPAAGITATAEIRTVQDYMAVDWPQVQFTYDSSTYFFGTMVHYAPAFSGLLLGVQ
jgi:hypothetical protein